MRQYGHQDNPTDPDSFCGSVPPRILDAVLL